MNIWYQNWCQSDNLNSITSISEILYIENFLKHKINESDFFFLEKTFSKKFDVNFRS